MNGDQEHAPQHAQDVGELLSQGAKPPDILESAVPLMTRKANSPPMPIRRIKAKIKKRRPKRKKDFRSGLEARIAEQLHDGGVPFTFERTAIPYMKNGKVSRYTPDFHVNKAFHLEAKGYFVGGAADRRKLILVKQQHPELDLRLVFQREGRLVSKDSRMTYADWADALGFPWAGGGTIPSRWIEEAMDYKQ